MWPLCSTSIYWKMNNWLQVYSSSTASSTWHIRYNALLLESSKMRQHRRRCTNVTRNDCWCGVVMHIFWLDFDLPHLTIIRLPSKIEQGLIISTFFRTPRPLRLCYPTAELVTRWPYGCLDAPVSSPLRKGLTACCCCHVCTLMRTLENNKLLQISKGANFRARGSPTFIDKILTEASSEIPYTESMEIPSVCSERYGGMLWTVCELLKNSHQTSVG